MHEAHNKQGSEQGFAVLPVVASEASPQTPAPRHYKPVQPAGFSAKFLVRLRLVLLADYECKSQFWASLGFGLRGGRPHGAQGVFGAYRDEEYNFRSETFALLRGKEGLAFFSLRRLIKDSPVRSCW